MPYLVTLGLQSDVLFSWMASLLVSGPPRALNCCCCSLGISGNSNLKRTQGERGRERRRWRPRRSGRYGVANGDGVETSSKLIINSCPVQQPIVPTLFVQVPGSLPVAPTPALPPACLSNVVQKSSKLLWHALSLRLQRYTPCTHAVHSFRGF